MSLNRRRDSTKARRICFDAHRFDDHLGRPRLRCHFNGCIIDPVKDEWRADHVITPWANGGEDTPENLAPICKRCDVTEKAPEDTRRIHKGRRIRDKHFHLEVKRKKQWSMPGWKYNWSTGRKEKIGADE